MASGDTVPRACHAPCRPPPVALPPTEGVAHAGPGPRARPRPARPGCHPTHRRVSPPPSRVSTPSSGDHPTFRFSARRGPPSPAPAIQPATVPGPQTHRAPHHRHPTTPEKSQMCLPRVFARKPRVLARTSRVFARASRIPARTSRVSAREPRIPARKPRVLSGTSSVLARRSSVLAGPSFGVARTFRILAGRSKITESRWPDPLGLLH